MLYVLCFGNPHLEDDNLAFKVGKLLTKDKIKDLTVIDCFSPDEIFNYFDKEFVILDVVKNIKEVVIIEDIDKLQANSICSLHDFDLGFFLKLMKKMGKINNIKIIGIPQKGNLNNIKKTVKKMVIQ